MPSGLVHDVDPEVAQIAEDVDDSIIESQVRTVFFVVADSLQRSPYSFAAFLPPSPALRSLVVLGFGCTCVFPWTVACCVGVVPRQGPHCPHHAWRGLADAVAGCTGKSQTVGTLACATGAANGVVCACPVVQCLTTMRCVLSPAELFRPSFQLSWTLRITALK